MRTLRKATGSPGGHRGSKLDPCAFSFPRIAARSQLPPPPPPPEKKKAGTIVLIGLAILAIDLALLGFALWERYSTIHYFSRQADRELLEITQTVIFGNQVRLEVSHNFKSGHYATIDVKIEKGSGTVVWQNEFNLVSPGTLVETKYDSAWIALEPGTYYVTVESSVPQGTTEIVAECMGVYTPFGQLYVFGLFPGLTLAGLITLAYAEDPQGLVPAVKKDFAKDWKTSLKNAAVIVIGWVLLIVVLAAALVFFRTIVGLIGVVLVLSAIGLVYEGLKKAGTWALERARGRRSS